MHEMTLPVFALTGKPRPKNGDLAPVHNFGLNRIARFARQATWTHYAALDMQTFIVNGKTKGGEWECAWEDYDPEYCQTIGLDIEELQGQIAEYIKMSARQPFPTAREIARQRRREARLVKSIEVYDRINAKLTAHLKWLNGIKPKRKTVKAQYKVDAIFIDQDRHVKFYRQQINRLHSFDPDLKYKLQRRHDLQRRYG